MKKIIYFLMGLVLVQPALLAEEVDDEYADFVQDLMYIMEEGNEQNYQIWQSNPFEKGKIHNYFHNQETLSSCMDAPDSYKIDPNGQFYKCVPVKECEDNRRPEDSGNRCYTVWVWVEVNDSIIRIRL